MALDATGHGSFQEWVKDSGTAKLTSLLAKPSPS